MREARTNREKIADSPQIEFGPRTPSNHQRGTAYRQGHATDQRRCDAGTFAAVCEKARGVARTSASGEIRRSHGRPAEPGDVTDGS